MCDVSHRGREPRTPRDIDMGGTSSDYVTADDILADPMMRRVLVFLADPDNVRKWQWQYEDAARKHSHLGTWAYFAAVHRSLLEGVRMSDEAAWQFLEKNGFDLNGTLQYLARWMDVQVGNFVERMKQVGVPQRVGQAINIAMAKEVASMYLIDSSFDFAGDVWDTLSAHVAYEYFGMSMGQVDQSIVQRVLLKQYKAEKYMHGKQEKNLEALWALIKWVQTKIDKFTRASGVDEMAAVCRFMGPVDLDFGKAWAFYEEHMRDTMLSDHGFTASEATEIFNLCRGHRGRIIATVHDKLVVRMYLATGVDKLLLRRNYLEPVAWHWDAAVDKVLAIEAKKVHLNFDQAKQYYLAGGNDLAATVSYLRTRPLNEVY